MLVTRFLSDLGQWPRSTFLMMGQWITVILEALVLLAVPATAPLVPRRAAHSHSRRTAGRNSPRVTALKVAIPFAVLGGGVVVDAGVGTPGDIAAGIPVQRPRPRLGNHADARADPASWSCSPGLPGPLLEELVFRGLLYRAFERQRGWLYAAVVTSILFGLAHPDKMIATGLGGLVLACVLRRTGSLRACVLLHALFNVLVSWPLLGQVLLSPRSGDLASPATWALPLACLAFVAVALPAYLWLAAHPARDRAAGVAPER